MLPTFQPRPPFHRRTRAAAPTAFTPAALTLLSASFDPDALTITLSFDRAIDIAGLGGDAIWVSDPVATGRAFAALGAAALLDPAAVRIGLSDQDAASGDAVTLSAGDTNGIVAASDGTPWAGVSDLGLPFP